MAGTPTKVRIACPISECEPGLENPECPDWEEGWVSERKDLATPGKMGTAMMP